MKLTVIHSEVVRSTPESNTNQDIVIDSTLCRSTGYSLLMKESYVNPNISFSKKKNDSDISSDEAENFSSGEMSSGGDISSGGDVSSGGDISSDSTQNSDSFAEVSLQVS